MAYHIKNLIFDLGKVLVDLDYQRSAAAFDSYIGTDNSSFIYTQDFKALLQKAELGQLSPADLYKELRCLVGKPVSDLGLENAWNALLFDISEERKERLIALKSRYKLYLLSNTNAIHWQKCASELFPYNGLSVDNMFNKIFLSYEMQMMKPDARIFNAVLTDQNLCPSETLFIDDNAENCNSAATLGIHTFTNKSINDWLSLSL